MSAEAFAQGNTGDFSRTLERINQLLARPAVSIMFTRAVFQLIRVSCVIESLGTAASKEMRVLLESCSCACEAPTECQQGLLAIATQVRDLLIHLDEVLQKHVYLFFLRRKISNLVVDWDDLVEDLTISQDREFSDLVSQLATSIASGQCRPQ